MTPKSFHTLIARLGERAGMPFPIHPHMHRNIQNTTRYTALAPQRFKEFFRD